MRSHNRIARRRPAGWPADFCPQQHSSSQSINCPIHYKVIPASQGTATQHAAHKAQRHLHVNARFKYVYHIKVSDYSSRSSVAAHLPTSEKYTSCTSSHCSFFTLLFRPLSPRLSSFFSKFQTRIRQHIIVYSLNAVVPITRSTRLYVWTRCAEGTVGDCVGGRMAQSV